METNPCDGGERFWLARFGIEYPAIRESKAATRVRLWEGKIQAVLLGVKANE
jgi:hypothetical protein